MGEAGSEQCPFPGLREHGNGPSSAIIGVTSISLLMLRPKIFPPLSNLRVLLAYSGVFPTYVYALSHTVSFVISACLSVDVGQLECPEYFR